MTDPLRTIDPNTIYDSAEVARLAHQRSLAWFYNYRSTAPNQRSQADAEGFPQPCNRSGHPRWLGAHLLAWLAAGPQARVAGGLSSPTVVDITAQLRARSRAIAERHLARRG